jgi:Nucleotidyl transferase AbiEii toxin, Type IV TA system
MISRRELDQLRAEWTLDIAVIEKDYLLGWQLAGIASHPVLGRAWVFKGGTCLRKCYYETFRFSEDLDFTVMPDGPDDPAGLREAFSQVAEWLREESGIELTVDSAAFRRRRNKRGKSTTQGRIAYRGPNPPQGRHRLPRRERTTRTTPCRAILPAPHQRREPDPIRRQRPPPAPQLPHRPHHRHQAHHRVVRAHLPGGILIQQSAASQPRRVTT